MGPYSITIEPATPEMLQTYFPDQAAQQRQRGEGPAIRIAKTVGLTSDCAVTDLQLIPGPTQVFYCYVFINAGSTTLMTTTIVDDQLGTLFNNLALSLPPGDGRSARATATVESTVKNIVLWEATDENGVTVTTTEDALVVVPTLALTTTLSTDPGKCGQERVLATLPDTTIAVCYTVKNTSPVTLTNHLLEDSSTGLVLREADLLLAPGAAYSVKRTMRVTQTSTNLISWTATTADGIVAKAVDAVTVQIPSIELQTTVGVDTTECPVTDAITVAIDSMVTICYVAHNTGGYTLDQHTAFDTLQSYAPFSSPLLPGKSLAFTYTFPVTDNVSGVGEWRASGPGGLLAIARDTFSISIRSDAVIEVLVFYDVDGQGSFQPLEPGISDVEVTLTSPRKRQYSVRTDDNGLARLEGLPEVGNYTATINMSTVPTGYVQSTVGRDIVVARGQIATQRIGFVAPPGTDSDEDTIEDLEETARDFDKDDIPNYLDLDSDDDGLSDKVEGKTDSDLDGVPNRLDPKQYTFLPIVNGE